MAKHLKAIHDNCIVRRIEDYENETRIFVDLTDTKNLRGVVLSVGEELENIEVGDTIVFSDGVKKLEGVLDEPVYRVKEDAIICKVV